MSKLQEAVDRASEELFAKLNNQKAKYGPDWDDQMWLRDDWKLELKKQLVEHLFKGDPLDVMAYCVFAFHHGWDIKPETFFAEKNNDKEVDFFYSIYAAISKARNMTQTKDNASEQTDMIIVLADLLTIAALELFNKERRIAIIENMAEKLEREIKEGR